MKQKGIEMDRAEVDKLFLLLEQFYPNIKPSDEKKLAWYLALKPYTYADVRAAAVEYVREGKFFPDFSDLCKGLPRSDGEKPKTQRNNPSHAEIESVQRLMAEQVCPIIERHCGEPLTVGEMLWKYEDECYGCPFDSCLHVAADGRRIVPKMQPEVGTQC